MNESVTVTVLPGGMVTPVSIPTCCGVVSPFPETVMTTVMTCVIPLLRLELLVRWRVAVPDWPFATGAIESALASSLVESVKPVAGRLFTTTIPDASLASTKTVRFFAPSRASLAIVSVKLPSGFVWKTGEATRYLLGVRDAGT